MMYPNYPLPVTHAPTELGAPHNRSTCHRTVGDFMVDNLLYAKRSVVCDLKQDPRKAGWIPSKAGLKADIENKQAFLADWALTNAAFEDVFMPLIPSLSDWMRLWLKSSVIRCAAQRLGEGKTD